MINFHKKMISKLGVIPNINKAIQEHQEYIEALKDFKTLYYSGDVDSDNMKEVISNIQEEGNDCFVMRGRVNQIFNFTTEDNKKQVEFKVKRTIKQFLK